MESCKTCIPDSKTYISVQDEDKINLSFIPKEPENKVPNFVNESGSKATVKLSEENNVQNSSGARQIDSPTSYDDSFEIFIPLKKCSSQKSIGVSSKLTGKQKFKKSDRTRSCPYFSTKSIKNHFKSPSKTKEERDLQVALARSLLDVSGSAETSTSNTCDSASTFNQFKKEENSFKLKNWTSKKNQKKKVKSLLSSRTSDDRAKIITQKIAIVLLQSKEVESSELFQNKIELSSSLLEEILNKNSTLWELSKINSGQLKDFYVQALSDFVEQPQSLDSDSEMAKKAEI